MLTDDDAGEGVKWRFLDDVICERPHMAYHVFVLKLNITGNNRCIKYSFLSLVSRRATIAPRTSCGAGPTAWGKSSRDFNVLNIDLT